MIIILVTSSSPLQWSFVYVIDSTSLLTPNLRSFVPSIKLDFDSTQGASLRTTPPRHP